MPDSITTSEHSTYLSQLLQASYEIALAEKDQDIFSITDKVFRASGFISALYIVEQDNLCFFSSNHSENSEFSLPGKENLPKDEISSLFISPDPILLLETPKTGTLLNDLIEPFFKLNAKSVGLIPIFSSDQFMGLVLIASSLPEPLTREWLQPYTYLANITGINLSRLHMRQKTQTRINGLHRSVEIALNVLFETDLEPLYKVIYSQVRQILGNVDFLIAIYSAETNLIKLPYVYEKDVRITIDPFPLGEGLTSLLIKNRKPLMFVNDAENQARAYGAKVFGMPAKSWMGVPLLVGEQVIGAMIVEDVEHEHRFTEDDLDFLLTLSPHIAASIRNAQAVSGMQQKLKDDVTELVAVRETAQRRAQQLLTAAEIARDVSGSLRPDELLSRLVNLVKDRFGFYHASIFLLNNAGDYAVLRESTGEAGRLLMQAGHQLAVGSKSIVGQVTETGTPFISNNVSADPTHLPNPLLPETQAEMAIPLKVAGRILGALDVQHTHINAFSEDDVSILQTLADQLSTAIVNSELFAEAQKSLTQHRALHQITTSASLAGNIDGALSSVVKGLQLIIEDARVAILLTNSSSNELSIKAWDGYPPDLNLSDIKIHLGKGITGSAALNRETVYLSETFGNGDYIALDKSIKSELAIPLLFRDELLGVLNLESPKTDAFSESDQEVLGILASSVSVVIANTRLIEQIRKQVERQQQLFEAASHIRRSVDIRTILETSAVEIGKALGAQRARIELNPKLTTPATGTSNSSSAKESDR